MNPIRPDLPTPRHAATHPVSTTSARVAQAAFFQQALAGLKTAQQTQEAAAPKPETAGATSAGRALDQMDSTRRPGSFLDITV